MSRRFFLPVILFVVLGTVIGCGSGTARVDPASGSGEEPEPGTTEPADASAEDPPEDPPDVPPDALPPEPPVLSNEALPDFSVADVNADSARYQEAVSPRDYLGQISAWYFGHST